MNKTVHDWVDYIQSLHMREIDLTLDRVREVYARLCPNGISFKVITVAGTNGKGSTAELLKSMYLCGGYRVGKYTSPHIVSFNERINVNGHDVDNTTLLSAFEVVEEARQETTLTYFEYATLVALVIFEQSSLDVVVLEVGLGGRKDATNMVDTDLAIVTSISIDHTAWLGDDIEQIGFEKIGIARAGKPCVLGMRNPPQSILNVCSELKITPKTIGVDFDIERQSNLVSTASAAPSWSWQGKDRSYHLLALPFGQDGYQLQNAATAVQASVLLNEHLPLSVADVAKGIAQARIAGRCQIVQEKPTIILDVAHNEDSIRGLAAQLRKFNKRGKTVAVCGMLKDKEIASALSYMLPVVDDWHLATINNERGSKASELKTILEQLEAEGMEDSKDRQSVTRIELNCHSDALEAYKIAKRTLTSDDCLVVFGSFFMVSDIIADLKD